MQELVSVIMAVYNEDIYEIRQAIESILIQTYKNIEYIIVLDNPQNRDAKKILEEYAKKDNRIKLVINSSNCGLPYSLNRAIMISKGDYIARMDADDISLPSRIEKEMIYMHNNNVCDVVGTNYIIIDEKNNETINDVKILTEHKDLRKALEYGNVIVHPSVIIRRKILEHVGGYREFFINSQDYDLWLRMLKNGYTFHVLPDALIKYRIRKNSISQVNPAKQYSYSSYARYLYKKEMKECKHLNENDFKSFLASKKLLDFADIDKFNNGYRAYLQYSERGEKVKAIKSLLSHRELIIFLLQSKKIDKIRNKKCC